MTEVRKAEMFDDPEYGTVPVLVEGEWVEAPGGDRWFKAGHFRVHAESDGYNVYADGCMDGSHEELSEDCCPNIEAAMVEGLTALKSLLTDALDAIPASVPVWGTVEAEEETDR